MQGGSPLPIPLRTRMERAFDRSFEGVRVHTGGAAAGLAREHHAEAVTIGSDIAFGEGRFQPHTPQGQHLVAHELAHVAQQGSAAAPVAQARSAHSVPAEPAEIAAESAAAGAVRGDRVNVGADYSMRGRVMRRALRGPAPPPNPAPLSGRVASARRAAAPASRAIERVAAAARAASPARVPPAAAQGVTPSAKATAAIDEVTAARPSAARALLQDVAPPAPRKSGAEGETQAQAETEQARADAKKVIEEEAPAPAPAAGDVPALAGGGAGPAPPPSIQEAPSVAADDKKEEAQAAAEAGSAGEEAKTDEAAPEGGAAPEDRAPASPGEDPAFRRVLARGRAVAAAQAHNNTAQRKAAEAQAAAPGPANEVEAMAGGQQVAKMAEQEPASFDKESFKAALIAKINEIAPGTLDDADQFKNRGAAGELKGAVVGQVEAGKEGAQGPIKQAAEETPSTAGVEAKTVTPQPPTEAGAPPPDIGAAAAAPKPKTDAEVSLDAGPKSIDDKMAEAKITDDTLANSHEPAFESALEEKTAAKEHAETAPVAYREAEAGIVAGAKSDASDTAQAQTGAMYDSRVGQFGAVQGQQDATRTADTDARTEVTNNIKAIFDETQAAVTERLAALDEEVNTAFDTGAESARQGFEEEVEREKEAYKERRYSGVDGAALWVRDLFLPLPDEVNQIYQTARENYITAMSTVIDGVATIVETGLNDAMSRVEEGRQAVTDYVAGLEGDLKTVGEGAAEQIQSQFDTLADEVKNAEQQMVAGLAQKYVDNLKAIDQRIETMKQDDQGLVGKAMDAIAGVIDTILELKEMLLGILAKAADVIETIIADPIGFLGNLVTGIKMGLQAFIGNIGEHLKSGLMGWLFGAVAAAGITMPEAFDLKGLLSLGAQILGLTYANFRARAVRIVGEPIVKAMETAVEIFRILMTEGLGGVWNYIKDMLGNLVDTVLDTIRNWVITKVITAGITWILSLLNPASAFVRACKMIIDVVMFFIERGSQIVSLVNAVLDSISAIASGALGAMASAVEGALARAVPVAISFLASLLGLGGISEMIRGAIEKIQAPVNKAIDWLINKAVKLAKSIAGLFGKKKEDEEETPETPDPEHDAKVTAGLADVDIEEQKYLHEGAISHEDADKVASAIKTKHPIFKSFVVVEGAGTWDYSYHASDGTVTGEKQSDDDGVLYVSLLDSKLPGGSTVGALNVRPSGHPGLFERNVTTAVEAATGLEAQTGVQRNLSQRGNVGNLPAEDTLVSQAIITHPAQPTVRIDATRAPEFGRQPDVLLERPRTSDSGPIVEVFEATLDASFLLKREEGVPGSSHKRTQLAGTIAILIARFPDVPIIYNIVTKGDPPEPVRKELELELKQLRRQYSAASIQIIWRS
jgi:hypothetical protein